ncbi:AAA family ATPase [Cytobacillus pseudoceanisediminis]|uniref:deoxynucleotide monophosphate kinase family protein n=1 Tax=Cytobacillus pseudoceanisediminis TaxID=3051614 RepID=UPI003CF16936
MGTKNMKTEIKVAVCGTLRSGKDTVANWFKEKEKFTSFAFSEGIWTTGRLLFPHEFNNPKVKPRKMLQDLGQKLREIDPDVWVRYTFNRIEEVGANRVIVTDLRQPNELEALKNDGFFIIRVNAEPEVRIERAKAAGDKFNYQDMLHETEKHVQGFQVDFDIDNNGTIEELESQIEKAFEAAVYRAKGLQHYKPKGGTQGGE